jgi:hypothetical protein
VLSCQQETEVGLRAEVVPEQAEVGVVVGEVVAEWEEPGPVPARVGTASVPAVEPKLRIKRDRRARASNAQSAAGP